MEASETGAREGAPLTPAAVVVAETVAGEAGTPLVDSKLGPDASDRAGISTVAQYTHRPRATARP